MNHDVQLCTDLDRTLLPNGPQPESPGARRRLLLLADRPELTLVYVSGRHKSLLLQATEDSYLPMPDYAIGDKGEQWQSWDNWYEEISPD